MPDWQQHPYQQAYDMPRMFDTRTRRASGLTGLRFPQPAVQHPQQAQPESAWATQQRRIDHIHQERTPLPWTMIIGWAATGFLLIGLLGMFALVAIQYGVAATVVYGIFALGSLVTIMLTMLIADRWHPMPLYVSLVAVLWGAVFAAAASMVVNTLSGIIAYDLTGDAAFANFVSAVISAPFIEELTKGLGVLAIFLVFRRHFNGPLDGLIIGALVGGGFAFVENITYYVRVAAEGGFQAAGVLIVLRGVIGIFGHCVYTSLTGMILGLVSRRFGVIAAVLSFLVAPLPGMALHALWNLSAGLVSSLVHMVLLFGGELLLFAVWLTLIALLMVNESRMTRARLGEYANAGWLTHDEVAMLATWKGRREGRSWARSIGAKKPMKRFIHEAAELAFTRQRLMANGGSPRALKDEQDLLKRLHHNRGAMLAAASGGHYAVHPA